MKKLNLIFVLLFAFGLQLNAQLEKSSLMIGGSGSFSGGLAGNAGFSSFQFQPRVGYFVANKFAIGAGIDMGYQRLRQGDLINNTGFGVGFSPFARYYFLKMENKFNLFAETSVGLSNHWNSSNGVTSSFLRFNTTTSAGFVYFIRPQIGIEAKLQLGSGILNPATMLYGPRLNGAIGFQIHLNKPSTK